MSEVVKHQVEVHTSQALPQVSVVPNPAPVAVRLVAPVPVGIERREIVSIEQRQMGASIIAIGMPGPPGADGTGTSETYVAGEALGGQRVVVTNTDGEAIYADNRTAAHANAANRITIGAVAAGDDVEVRISGRMTEPSWSWTPGDIIYLGQNGLLTATPPASPAAFSRVVAVAETATTIMMVQEPPLMLA